MLNVVCTIHLVQALRVARDLHLNYWVYDMLEGKCVHIVLKELNFWFYSNNPCKSVRLYTLANSISLAGPKDNIWACTPIDIAQAWGGTGRQNCSLEAQTSLEAKWRTRRRHRRVAAVIVGC